jgi:hypothetical protein
MTLKKIISFLIIFSLGINPVYSIFEEISPQEDERVLWEEDSSSLLNKEKKHTPLSLEISGKIRELAGIKRESLITTMKRILPAVGAVTFLSSVVFPAMVFLNSSYLSLFFNKLGEGYYKVVPNGGVLNDLDQVGPLHPYRNYSMFDLINNPSIKTFLKLGGGIFAGAFKLLLEFERPPLVPNDKLIAAGYLAASGYLGNCPFKYHSYADLGAALIVEHRWKFFIGSLLVYIAGIGAGYTLLPPLKSLLFPTSFEETEKLMKKTSNEEAIELIKRARALLLLKEVSVIELEIGYGVGIWGFELKNELREIAARLEEMEL